MSDRQPPTVGLASPPAPRRIGRPPLTDRATIVSAALAIGYRRLTVGTVTSAVGVKYSTFYRHFPTIERLQAACIDHHLAAVAWPVWSADGTGWTETLAEYGAELVHLAEQQPGIGQVLGLLDTEPERLVDERAQAVAAIRAAGATGGAAAAVVRAVEHLAVAPAASAATGQRATRLTMIALAVDGAAARIDRPTR